jgi:hypothetical protein
LQWRVASLGRYGPIAAWMAPSSSCVRNGLRKKPASPSVEAAGRFRLGEAAGQHHLHVGAQAAQLRERGRSESEIRRELGIRSWKRTRLGSRTARPRATPCRAAAEHCPIVAS